MFTLPLVVSRLVTTAVRFTAASAEFETVLGNKHIASKSAKTSVAAQVILRAFLLVVFISFSSPFKKFLIFVSGKNPFHDFA